jgi:hypothetical protein
MDSSSKHSFKTSIHLNITDLNSSGQSSTVSDCNESDDDDSKLLQFKRVFKHLEVSFSLFLYSKSRILFIFLRFRRIISCFI